MRMITCRKADLQNTDDAQLMVSLLDAYANDPMGGGEALSEYSKLNLAKEISKRPFGHVFFGYLDDKPVGLAICFEGFSTFYCAPLMNVHDLCVLPGHRRKGVGISLLFYVEQYSQSIGCCKITLEVLEGNHPARNAYHAAGFRPYELDPDMGHAMFWQKLLK